MRLQLSAASAIMSRRWYRTVRIVGLTGQS
jgi:hypothetical protein